MLQLVDLSKTRSNNSNLSSNNKKIEKTEEDVELAILRKIKEKRIEAQNIRPFVISIKEAIKDDSKIGELLTRWGLERGFLTEAQEEYLSTHPEKIIKSILNAYFHYEEGCHAKLNSSFKPMDIKKLQIKSRKEIEHHNSVEDAIKALNNNYIPKYL